MRIEDIIHDVMAGSHHQCHRCGVDATNGGFLGRGSYRLCPACLVDFDWWFEHPPEIPNKSSDNMVPKENT